MEAVRLCWLCLPMPQPEPPRSDPGSDELITSGSTVEVGGSETITVTDASAGRDLSITKTILQAPKPNPTLPAETPHNLPERTTSAERFVGRSQELEQLKSLLAPEGSRAHLTGMGGVGKSELAIQHAYDSFALYRGRILRLDARQGLDAMAVQVVTLSRGVFPDLAQVCRRLRRGQRHGDRHCRRHLRSDHRQCQRRPHRPLPDPAPSAGGPRRHSRD
jgi:hypothetical protein